MLVLLKPTLQNYLIGLGLIVLGQGTRFWSAGFIAKCEELAVSGPYSIFRNPLYVGTFLIACGYCVMTGSWIAWAVIIPMFVATHGSAVMWEERFLRGKFGKSFEDYCRKVPRWFPRIPARGTFGGGHVSWAQVKHNKEHTRCLGTVLVVILLGLRLIFGK
jgi:hypothetical protein